MSDAADRPSAAAPSTRVVHLDDLERIDATGEGLWRPIRRALGITAFGINAYTATAAGEPVVERHDETGTGAGVHEELYLVVQGRARFRVGDEEIEAPQGTIVFIPDPAVKREARAEEDGTTVVVVGGRPGAALPGAPYEYWFAAQAPYQAGDYKRAVEIVSEGLETWPDHGTIHYQLACFHALDGNPDAAVHHLDRAFTADPRTREWASDDTDLDSIRDAFPD